MEYILIIKNKFYPTSASEPIPAIDLTISGIAYNSDPQFGYTIFIKEGNELEPYLVLTNEYNNEPENVLLLRQYLLDEKISYHESKQTPNYSKSNIDNYLNTEFLDLFEPTFKNKILTSNISYITSLEESQNEPSKNYIANVQRQVFLLSIDELNIKSPEQESNTNDGITGYGKEPLKYFIDAENQAWSKGAYKKDQVSLSQQWLRSPSLDTTLTNHTSTVYEDSILEETVDSLLHIRPAFCISGYTKIQKVYDDNTKKLFIF